MKTLRGKITRCKYGGRTTRYNTQKETSVNNLELHMKIDKDYCYRYVNNS
jgi:hypothetical protein